jgi:flagellar biosynthesis protein FlhF
VARAVASTSVTDRATGAGRTLARLDHRFGEARAVQFGGRPALLSEAECEVLLRFNAAAAAAGLQRTDMPTLRCVVTRIVDARSEKVLQQSYVLSNLGSQVDASQLAQWQAWANENEPCFRLIRQGVQLVGGVGELGDPNMMKRVLIAGQMTTTVWRLLRADGEWAERTRALMHQLSGRPARASRPLSGNALYAGMGKLFLLLEALGTESTAPTQRSTALEQQG